MRGKESPRIRNGLRIVVSAAALALGGCGGGGGDGGGSATAPKMNSSNSVAVASRAYSVADALYSTGSAAASAMKSVGGSSNGVRLNLAEFAVRRLLNLGAGSAGGGGIVGKAIVSDSGPCPLGGTISLTANDADDSGTLTSGDTGSITFTNCVDADGVRYDGTFSFSNLSYTGSSVTPSQTLAATFTFSNFRATLNQDSASVNGDFTVQAAITNVTPYSLDLAVSGTKLVLAENNWTETLTQFSASVFIDITAGTYAYNIAGAISGTDLPDTITLATPRTLAGSIGSYPTMGAITATASDGTAARLTVNSAASVAVDLDGNADGVFESSQTMTWAQLAAI